jgi:hypothetical protein
MFACSWPRCSQVQRVQSENQAESRSGNVCRHTRGAAAVRLVSVGAAHRCWLTVPAKALFGRLGFGPINGLALTHCAVVGSE